MFRQDDLSQFFLGNSGPLKRQNEQRTQYFKDYEKYRNKTTYVKFVYLMSFNHFQLARVNQLLQITYGQSAVFLNGQGKQVEY
jgi:hypothetical protein